MTYGYYLSLNCRFRTFKKKLRRKPFKTHYKEYLFDIWSCAGKCICYLRKQTVLYNHEDLRQRWVGECQRVYRGKIPGDRGKCGIRALNSLNLLHLKFSWFKIGVVTLIIHVLCQKMIQVYLPWLMNFKSLAYLCRHRVPFSFSLVIHSWNFKEKSPLAPSSLISAT